MAVSPRFDVGAVVARAAAGGARSLVLSIGVLACCVVPLAYWVADTDDITRAAVAAAFDNVALMSILAARQAIRAWPAFPDLHGVAAFRDGAPPAVVARVFD